MERAVRHRLLPLIALLALAGCGARREAGPIEASVIGDAMGNGVRASDRARADGPSGVLIGATGQGLVRFDASGQVVPGVAARWIVGGEGRSLIFRLADLPQPGAQPIDAGQIARRLRAAILPAGRNPLVPLLGAIDEIDAVTPQVIDIELKAPRPNLLQLLAQPALAMGGAARGPMTIAARQRGAILLRPLPPADADPDSDAPLPPPVLLRADRAGVAVARFMAGRSQLVLGGRLGDLGIAQAADVPPGALRIDPVHGLFGFAFVAGRSGPTADVDIRRALAMAIDRERIGALLAIPGWTSATAIVAPGTQELEHPVQPAWVSLTSADRRTTARGIVAKWRGAHGAPPALRVALPPGPGMRALFALVAQDWRAIGIDAVAVDLDEDADLRLVDEVAPADIASFYLRSFACERQVPCTPESDRMLIAARIADTLAARAALLAEADAAIADDAPFVALGMPVRWSLVDPALDLYRESPRAIHPLIELQSPLKR